MPIFKLIGSAVCHQLPERTLTVHGLPLPVCARCTGIYTGVFLSALFLLLTGRWKGNKVFSVACAVIIAAAVFPMMLDGVTSALALRESTHMIRIITGALFGVCLPVLYTLTFRFDANGHNDRVIVTSWGMLALLAVSVIVALLIVRGMQAGWFAVSFAVCVSILMIPLGVIGLVYKYAKQFLFSKKLGNDD